MDDAGEMIRVGVVGRAHGIRGAIRVFMDDANSGSLLRVKTVCLGDGKKPYEVQHATRCGRFVALELEGVTDRDEAFKLTGQTVWIRRNQLAKLRNAYYVCDLIGLMIRDESGREWGRIDAVMPSGAHDLLEYVRSDGNKGMVPFVAAHVGKVDFEAGTVDVDGAWMAELDAIYGET